MPAVFGAATLAHLLVVSWRGRRREIGLLKAPGFVNGHGGCGVPAGDDGRAGGLDLGVLLGVGAGDVIWSAFASNVGVVPVTVVQVPAGRALANPLIRRPQETSPRVSAGGTWRGHPARA